MILPTRFIRESTYTNITILMNKSTNTNDSMAWDFDDKKKIFARNLSSDMCKI